MNLLYIMVFLDMLGVGLIIPVVTAIPKALQMDAVAQGSISSLYAACQFFCNPLLGKLSDTYGRKKIFMLSLSGWSDFLLLISDNFRIVYFLSDVGHCDQFMDGFCQ